MNDIGEMHAVRFVKISEIEKILSNVIKKEIAWVDSYDDTVPKRCFMDLVKSNFSYGPAISVNDHLNYVMNEFRDHDVLTFVDLDDVMIYLVYYDHIPEGEYMIIGLRKN